jgi:hypothetical protein
MECVQYLCGTSNGAIRGHWQLILSLYMVKTFNGKPVRIKVLSFRILSANTLAPQGYKSK